MRADRLLTSAAMAIRIAGSRTSIGNDSTALVPYSFPICNRNTPIAPIRFKFGGAALVQRSVACWIDRISVGFVQSRGMLDVGTEGISIMRKLMIAAALVSTALATPALARD